MQRINEMITGFCRDCGTPLFYRSLSTGSTNLTIGSLDEPHRFKPLGHDGVESRVPWFAQITKIEDEAATEQEDNRTWVDAISRSNRQHPDHDTEKWPP